MKFWRMLLLMVVAALPFFPLPVARAQVGDGVAATSSVPRADVLLQRAGRVAIPFNASANTDVARGAALRRAVAACQAGDTLDLAGLTFDISIVTGSTKGTFQFPANVTISGVRGRTKLTSSATSADCGSFTQYEIADGLLLQNLWIDMSLSTGGSAYQVGLGSAVGGAANRTATLVGCKITGYSDGLYLWTGTAFVTTLRCIDCDIETSYDGIAMLGNDTSSAGQVVELHHCRINTVYVVDFTTFGKSHCAIVSAGTIKAFHTSFVVVGSTSTSMSETNCIGCLPTGGGSTSYASVDCRNCSFSSATTVGAASIDVQVSGSNAFVRLGDCTGSKSDGAISRSGSNITLLNSISSTSTYGAGTAYSLTTTAALIDMGTTDPSISITGPATYLLFGRASVKYNGATFAANQTVTIKIRRTSPGGQDLAGATTTATLDIVTTKTATAVVLITPFFVRAETLATPTYQLWASVSALPSAGSVDVTECELVAVKLF